MGHDKMNKQNPQGEQKTFVPFFVVLLSVGVFLIYSNTLHAPFVFDDIANIKENPIIQIHTLSYSVFSNLLYSLNGQRPLAIFSFALNYYFDQYNPIGYHLANILIHIINGILLYFITQTILKLNYRSNYDLLKKRALSIKIAALLSSALWLLNPIQLFSVTYIVQRMNSLAALFSLVSIIFYIKARVAETRSNDHHRKLHTIILTVISIFSLFAAIASKQNAIIVPLLILLIETHFFSTNIKSLLRDLIRTRTRLIITCISLFCILTIFILIFYLNTYGDPVRFLKNLYKGKHFSLLERLNTQSRILVYYISLIFYPSPSRLALLIDIKKSVSIFNPITTLLAYMAIFCTLLTGFFTYRKNYKLISFAIFWFFIAHIIESTVLPLELIYIHRNYLPSMFAFLPLCGFVLNYKSNRENMTKKIQLVLLFFIFIIVLLFAYWTYDYNQIWHSSESFWADNALKSPKLERVQANYGTALFLNGHSDEAEKAYLKALKINPKNYITYFNLARIYDETKRHDKALRFYSASLRRNKKFTDAWRYQGFLLFSLGDRENGLSCLYKAWELDKFNPETNAILGNALYQEGKIKGALFHLGKAIKLAPYNVNANMTMGLIAMDAKDYENAEKYFNKVLKAEESNPLALLNLNFIRSKLKEENQ